MSRPRRREPRLFADQVTVALVPKAATDLQSIHERTRMSKTDIVNRAVSLYEFIDVETSTGAEIIVRRGGQDYAVELL